MRILTWNIFGVSCFDSVKILNPFNDAKPRYPYIKEAIKESDPDILLLQEVIFPWDNSFVSSIEGYHFHNKEIVRSSGLAAGTKGKPQAVNYTTFKDQARLFNPKQFSDKFLRKGYQELDLGDLVVINTHLANSYTKTDTADSTMNSQAEQLLEHIRERKKEDRRIILGGDLNFRKGSPLYDAFENELKDLTKDLPIEERGYNKADFIFANCGELRKSGYVWHPSFRGSYPSDHRGIYVDLDF